MSCNNQHIGVYKQSSCISFTYACLVLTLILLTSFLVLAVSVTAGFIDWKTPLPCESPGCHKCEETEPKDGRETTPPGDSTASLVTPSLLQIQVLGDSDSSARDVVVDQKENPWIDELLGVARGAVETQVIDTTVRAVVLKQMGCAPGERLSVSGFIRFPRNTASIDDVIKGRIDAFTRQVGDSGKKWGVFGFASEEGNIEENRKLSWQRACAVKKYICKNCGCSSCDIGCSTYPKDKGKKVKTGHKCTITGGKQETGFLIKFLGEEHFINGVADSRSVVIAACRK